MTKFQFFFEAQLANALESPKGRQLTGYASIDNLGGLKHGLNVIAVESMDEIEMFLLNSPYLVKFYPYLAERFYNIDEVRIINCMNIRFKPAEGFVTDSRFVNIVFVIRNQTKEKIPNIQDITKYSADVLYTRQWGDAADVVIMPKICRVGSFQSGSAKDVIILPKIYHDSTLDINIVKYKYQVLPTQPETINIQKFYNPEN